MATVVNVLLQVTIIMPTTEEARREQVEDILEEIP
jgi:hypothetical protein